MACEGLKANQHFTEPPPRFTEATLIKAMEERGIGRPSTYAPTIGTLMGRYYVERKQTRLFPTTLGITLSDLLTEYFPGVMDLDFTAGMEEELDAVSRGRAGLGANAGESSTAQTFQGSTGQCDRVHAAGAAGGGN